MSWKCPLCNSENNSISRCFCGYEIDLDSCPKCGKELVKGSSFCQNCGAALLSVGSSSLGLPVTTSSVEHSIEPSTTNVIEDTKQCPPNFRVLKANKKIIEEAICKICNAKFAIGEDIKQCEKCLNYFHIRCWEEKGGCNQPDCKEETKPCPMCGKEIKKSALKCKHCKEYLDESIRKRHIPKGRVKEASSSLTYAIIGLFFFGFILGWVAISKGRKALKIIKDDPGYTGKGMAIAGIIIGIFDILGWIAVIISR